MSSRVRTIGQSSRALLAWLVALGALIMLGVLRASSGASSLAESVWQLAVGGRRVIAAHDFPSRLPEPSSDALSAGHTYDYGSAYALERDAAIDVLVARGEFEEYELAHGALDVPVDPLADYTVITVLRAHPTKAGTKIARRVYVSHQEFPHFAALRLLMREQHAPNASTLAAASEHPRDVDANLGVNEVTK